MTARDRKTTRAGEPVRAALPKGSAEKRLVKYLRSASERALLFNARLAVAGMPGPTRRELALALIEALRRNRALRRQIRAASRVQGL